MTKYHDIIMEINQLRIEMCNRHLLFLTQVAELEASVNKAIEEERGEVTKDEVSQEG